ncbi:MAG: phage holin family protein [Bacillota bacterium]
MKFTDLLLGFSISSITIFLIGGVDKLVTALLVFMVCDYVTGISASFMEGTLSSRKGFWGLARKLLIFVFIIVGHWIDVVTGNTDGFIRNAVLLILIANEGISILENMGRLGFKIPKPLKDALMKLNGK